MSDGVFRIYPTLNGRVGYPHPGAVFAQPKKIRLQWQYLSTAVVSGLTQLQPPLMSCSWKGLKVAEMPNSSANSRTRQ
jgi:hypothetical protein